ncbi:MATE family efflux transporter [Halomonas denitrificans]|nr:MATE family efflux transporter [Halomonas denitrificans]
MSDPQAPEHAPERDASGDRETDRENDREIDRENDSANARSKDRDLTSGPVSVNLLRLAGPMLFGIAAVISVQLVDTYFVGRLGTDALAALSFSFPVALTLTSLSIGLAAGAASVVSRAVGEGQQDRMHRRATDALLLASVIAVLMAAVGILLVRPLFQLLGAQGDVLDLVVAYMRIWFLSLPFVVVPMVANAMVRACGDAFWPSFIMIAASVVNAAVTPLLIFGWGPVPGLGIEGAAVGTLVARVLSLAMALYLVLKRDRLVEARVPAVRPFLRSAREVLWIGLPAAIGNASNPAGIAVATALIAVLGSQVVAGFGVATRLEAFAILPMLALSSAIGPMAGQNWGAGEIGRVRKALGIAYAICAGWSLLLAGLFALFGQTIAGWFASETSVAEEAARYLHIVPISLWGYGVAIVAAGGFNGLGKSLTGLSYSLTRIAVFYVPMVWIASRIDGSETVYAAIAAANGLAGIAIAWHSLRWLKKAEQQGLAEDADGDRSEGGSDRQDDTAPAGNTRTDPARC